MMTGHVEHPAFCARILCTATESSGSHVSQPVVAGVITNRPAPIAAELYQPTGASVPLVILTVPDYLDPPERHIPMSVAEAWHVASILAQLAREAGTR